MGRYFVWKIVCYVAATAVGFVGFFVAWNFSYVRSVIEPTPTADELHYCPVLPSMGEQLLIPDLHISTPLIVPETPADAAIEKALESGAAYYPGTPLPGDGTNTVITGHSSAPLFYKGNYATIFSRLDALPIGSLIYIFHHNSIYTYAVTSQEVVAPTDLAVLNQTPDEQLTLITCWPPGTTWERRIVLAKRVQ